MERNRQKAPKGSVPESGSGEIAVASRRSALDALASAFGEAQAPGTAFLLTGEAGAGKTWLRRRLEAGLPAGRRVVVVEAGPAYDAADFLTLAAAALGLEADARPAPLRLAIAAALEDEGREGRSCLLAVENAQHASPEVWAEVEALADGLGAPGGFAGLILVGRTELVRRLASRSMRHVAGRLSKHVHLPPLDVEEASRLLPGVDADEVERLHRDAAGNARRLLALAGVVRPAVPAAPPARREALAPRPAPALPDEAPAAPTPQLRAREVEAPADAATEAAVSAPALLPSRPPLRVEDGLIEVGWDGSLEAERSAAFDDLDEPEAEADVEDEDEDDSEEDPAADERVEDHYAALQAWTEWARNRDRLGREAASAEAPEPAPADVPEASSVEEGDPEERDEAASVDEEEPRDEEEDSPLGDDLRAEPRHEHAPYSQLFTRLRQSS